MKITIEQRMKRYQAAYRLYRRYLMKFYPEIASTLNCEGLTAKGIEKKEEELVNWEGKYK